MKILLRGARRTGRAILGRQSGGLGMTRKDSRRPIRNLNMHARIDPGKFCNLKAVTAQAAKDYG